MKFDERRLNKKKVDLPDAIRHDQEHPACPIIKGLPSYNLLQNPYYVEDFALTDPKIGWCIIETGAGGGGEDSIGSGNTEFYVNDTDLIHDDDVDVPLWHFEGRSVQINVEEEEPPEGSQPPVYRQIRLSAPSHKDDWRLQRYLGTYVCEKIANPNKRNRILKERRYGGRELFRFKTSNARSSEGGASGGSNGNGGDIFLYYRTGGFRNDSSFVDEVDRFLQNDQWEMS